MPDEDTVLRLNPSVHHEVVVERHLQSGIEVRVHRDGTFLFDFSTWEHAPQIEIPGYRTPGSGISHRPPVETEKAVSQSERYAVMRAQVMNVHQVCVATAEMVVKRSSGGVGLPLIPSDLLKGLTFEQCLRYREDAGVRSLARDALNNRHAVNRQRPYSRHVLDAEVIAYSLDLLDNVLCKNNKILIQMIEALYLSVCRHHEGRFGEAITLSWGVCEQLLAASWEAFIDELTGTDRMPNTRRHKLDARDYTASVRTEFLEFDARIDQQTYQSLEVARRARNDWAHKLKEPDGAQVAHSIHAAEGLLRRIHGLEMMVPLTSASPGVPGWHTWI